MHDNFTNELLKKFIVLELQAIADIAEYVSEEDKTRILRRIARIKAYLAEVQE